MKITGEAGQAQHMQALMEHSPGTGLQSNDGVLKCFMSWLEYLKVISGIILNVYFMG